MTLNNPRFKFVTLMAANESFRHALRVVGAATADLIWPPRCPFCMSPATVAMPLAASEPPRSGLCSGCRELLVYPLSGLCSSCALPRPAVAGGGPCGVCRKRRPRVASVTALGLYRDAMREGVIAAKKLAYEYLAQALASELAARLLGRDDLPRFDFVTYVPTHWTRFFQRGGSGTETAAEQISRSLDIPLRAVVYQYRRTKKQGMLSAAERRKNVRDAFRLREGYDLRGQVGLLIDDVFTTGATVEEVARLMRAGGVSAVHVGVFARSTGQFF